MAAPLTSPPGSPRATEARERVRCKSCDFRWYGMIAAHGLSVLGSCPRCHGELEFSAGALASEARVDAEIEVVGRQPWQVLGLPSLD